MSTILPERADAKGQPEQYEHDRLGRLVKIIDAEQGETLLEIPLTAGVAVGRRRPQDRTTSP